MVQFVSINFFSWISSIFVGFFKSSCFFLCHSVPICLTTQHHMTVTLGQMNIAHSITSPFHNTSFNIIVPLMSISLKVNSALYIYYNQNIAWICHLSNAYHMLHPSSLLVKMTNYGTLHYVVFSSLLLHSLSQASITVNAVNK